MKQESSPQTAATNALTQQAAANMSHGGSVSGSQAAMSAVITSPNLIHPFERQEAGPGEAWC